MFVSVSVVCCQVTMGVLPSVLCGRRELHESTLHASRQLVGDQQVK